MQLIRKSFHPRARDVVQHFWKAGYFGAAAILLGVLVLIWASVYALNIAKLRDTNGARLRSEIATVTKQSILPSGRGSGRVNVTVNLNGKEYTFDFNGYLPDISEMQQGQKVRVEYRIGKSGQVYIETMSPIEPSASSGTVP